MPAFNEAAMIGQVIGKIKSAGFDQVVVINDGSIDQTATVAQEAGVLVLSHPINRGLGAALATGFCYANLVEADLAVTIDSDGQHDPQAIPDLIKPILEGEADVVIGSRLINPDGMPWYRIIGNWALTWLTGRLFGLKMTDSQSGFRAFSKLALEKISIQSNRMEVSSEIFSEIKRNNLRFKEIPIKAIYTNYSLKKGQPNLNAISIIRRLLFQVLKKL